MKASSGNNTRISRSTGGKRKLLSGTGGAALALALFLPSTAWAEDYTAGTEAELSQRILEANADGDPSSTITLIGHIPLSGPLPASTKPLIINTGAFAVLNLALTGIVTVNGTVGGNDDLAGGAGQTGLSLVALGGVLTTVTNNAIVTGGDGTGTGANGIGAVVQNNGNLINNGSITGGSSGGPGTLAGGRGIEVSGNATVVNNGLIQGGVGHTVTGGTGAYVGVGASGVQSFTNNASGIVRGGRSTSGALGGVGIELRTLTVPIINRGLIEGGNGAAAIQASTQPVNIINSGTIRAGVDGTVAMDFSQAQLVLLELQAGSSITGLVIANAAPTFAQTLQLGGTVDASFDMSSVGAGAQYRNFNRFVKTGTSSWTLTGNAGGMPNSPWELQQGTLVFDDTATGQTPAMLGSGALVFQQDGNLSVGNLNGALSVLQSGPGTTTLVGNAHSGGTTITGGRLSIGTEAALGSGAFTINSGTLQWTGAGNIARTIGWGASGGGFEVAGGNLILLRPLLGGGALTKSGTGTLTLAGDNTYMGGTTIAAGALNIGSGGTTGSVLGDILNNSTLQFNRSNDYTYAGAITGTGGLAKAGTGTTTLTGQNNYGSGTSLSSGQLLIAGGGTTTSGGATSITALGASTPVLGVDGAGSAFTTASINATGNTNRSIAINVTNGGLLRTTSGGLSLRTAQLLPSATNTAQLTIDGGGSLADLAGGLTIASVSTNTGSVSISAGGALRTGDVSAIGFATGNTRVLPTVTITGAGSNWTSTSSLAMSNGGFTLDQGGTASFASAAFGTASAVLQAKLTVSGATSRFTTTSGDLVIGSGTGTGELVLTDGGAVDVAGSLVLADGGTASGILSIGGGEGQAAAAMGAFTAPTVTLGSASSRINFNHTGIGQLFGAAIAGAGAINHVAGDTVLTGNSAGFTGATTVSGGTLRVNGTLGGAASTVTVQSGGRLGGSGTIGGNVTVTNGVLAPGNSPGTLTITGDLALTGGSLLDFEFGQSNVVGGPLNDLIVVGGNLTLDGTVDVTVTPGGSFDVGVYRIISYAGSLNDQGLVLGSVPSGLVVAQTSVANQVNLVNFDGADVNFWDGVGGRGDSIITGGSGVWQANSGNDNWTVADGSVNTPYPNDAFAVFMAAPGTVTIDTSLGAVNASGMQFASNGYILTGGAIGLTGTQSVIRVGDGTALGAGFTATIASNLTGAGDLMKTDLGTLVLTGASSFVGEAIVKTGGLHLADGGTLTSLNTIIGRDASEQAVLTITGSDGGGNVSTWTSGELTVGYTGTGTLNVTAGGRVVSTDGAIGLDTGGVGHMLVSGSGSTWQNSGRINVGSSGTGTMRIENGAQVSSNDGIVGASALGEVVVTGAGSSWVNATQLNVGSFGTGTLRIENGARVTSNQGYVGANADGAATVTGAGSNWLVTDFSLTVGNQGNGALTIENGARIQALGGLSLGAAAGSNGTLTLLGTAADRGILETRQIGAGPGTVNVILDGGLLRATRNVSNFFTGFGARDVTLGANGGAIDTNGYDIGIAPRFVGAGDLIKDGAGTLTLTGANAYSGTTAVNAGTLLVNGNQSAATGLTTIATAATLGGIGTIGGSVDMSAGGTLAPGNSPGTLTINGNLLLGAGTQLNFELGQANVVGEALNDLVNVGGNLTLDGTLNVTQPAGGSFGVGIYRLINYGGTLTNNGLTIGSLPAGSEAFVQTVVPGQVNLVNTAGLTLGFWDGAASTKNDGAIQGGVGTWRVGGGENNWTEAFGAVNADYAQDSFAIFSGLGGTVTIDNGNGNVRAAGMQFAIDGYALMGGPLELTGADAFVRVGDGSAGDAAITATIASALTGSARLVKDMGGTLILTGANSYTGGTAINGGTLNVSSDANLGDAAGGLSFDGGTLDITTTFASNRAVDLVGTGTLVTQGTGFVLRGAVSGAGALVKEGNGSLTLTADNSHTGGTTINAGVLNLGEGGTTGSILGNIVNNGRFTINRSNMYILTGTISGSGELFQMGTGTTILTAANSYTGATRVSAGTLLINGDQSAATGLTSLAANATLGGTGTIGGDVRVGNGTLAPGAGGAGTLAINGDLSMVAGSRLAVDFGAANAVGSPLNDLVSVGGNLTLDGTIDVTVTPGGAFDIGLYRIANYAGTLTNNGLAIGTMPAGAELSVQTSILGQVNLVNTGSAVLNFWDGNTGPKFNGAVNGGSGVWWATGTDNWTDATGAVNASYDNGAFAVFAGRSGLVTIDNSQGAVTASGLQIAASGGYVIQGGALTLTGPQSVIRVGDGTTAGIGYSATITSGIIGNTQLVKTDLGRLVLAGVNSYTGGTAINGGTLRISSDANLGAASGGLSFNSGTLNTTANISSARTVDLAGQGVFSTDAGTTLTLTGNLTGAGLIGKVGAGTLVLAGTGSRTGGIEVVQGTLLVNGNYAAATGLVTMNQIARLGGTGTIGGNVNLSGTLAPGADGVGTLTINGDLLISQTATLAYEFGAANVAGGALNDLVNVGGNLILDGTINVTVPAGGAFGAGLYRVFNYGGTFTDNGLTLGAMPAGSNVGVQTSIAGQVNLVNFAGLALNFWDGAAGPKNNGVVNGGSGVWQSSGGNDNWTDAAGLVNAGYSDGAFAVFGGTSGTVTIDNSLGQVTAGGMQFAADGYTITGGGLALTGGQATVRVGDGSTASTGYTATINAALSGASELVKADAGTLVLGGTNSYTGGTRITGGTVQIASDANLGAAAGGLTFDGGTLAATATLNSARAVNLLGAGTLSTANGTVFMLSGTLTGAGALTKTGGGTLLLTGNNGGYTGATRVTGGTLAVMGAFGGAVDVGAGTRLEGTGSVGAVTNAGTVAPGRDGFGTLTVNGSYTGSNGILAIDAELGGDNSRADRLVVNGATAGNTVINVTNQGGLGAATVDGIKIIDVTGPSNGAFALGNSDYLFEGDPALIAGAYGYRLYKNGVTTPADGDWYLRSSLLQPTAPQTPNIPLYQPGVPVYEAYGQTLAALNQIGTMQERTGNRQWAEGNAQSFGIWGRMESKRARPEAVRSTSFTDVNVDSWKVELGADKVLSERVDGASLVLGVLGSYGEANASIASPYGNGSIKTQGYSAGATLSWLGAKGFYVDGRAQVSWFDSKLTSTVLGKLADDNKGTGQAYSIEIGKRAPIGAGLSITPQIQTVYSTVGFDRFTDPNDAAVSSKLGDSLKTRWGLSLDRQDGRSHLYGVVNLSYEWLDGTVTDVSGTPIGRENHRLWGELGLGGSLKLGSRLVLYSEVSADTAINDFGDSYALKGVAGLRMAF